MRRYPRVTAHTARAAQIGLDGLHNRENWCEYVYTCFDRNARACLKQAIRFRHHHRGYMAEYRLAKKLVDRYLETGEQPLFASWF